MSVADRVLLDFVYPSAILISENRLRRRFIFMGILNAIFAPFIILYLLIYSFFRYFEVCLKWLKQEARYLIMTLGISQESIFNWKPTVYALCAVEIPRIQ